MPFYLRLHRQPQGRGGEPSQRVGVFRLGGRYLGISEKTIFGNQTPFYFSMSVTDIYATIRTGAQLHVIPKSYFSFPALLIRYLNERQVNTIYWVPSALSIVANLKVLDFMMAEHIEKVLFAGEVMPAKQLNYWRSKYPNALFANLFGPTETTDICTYYIVDREIKDTESVPIGIACDNCDSFVVTEDGRLAGIGEEGELYARGSFLAMGYYNDPDKTAAALCKIRCKVTIRSGCIKPAIWCGGMNGAS